MLASFYEFGICYLVKFLIILCLFCFSLLQELNNAKDGWVCNWLSFINFIEYDKAAKTYKILNNYILAAFLEYSP